ncbi:MAG: hypothetical protein ACLQBB_12335 [Solirubrobacteraceae bacterium]
MRSRAVARVLLAASVVLVALLAVSGPAQADVFGTISLLSASPFGQAEYAHDPALSEDGRYVVFDGSIGGVPGVWRRETRPGAAIEQVAGGDATLPSVSAEGRYVSFTTNQGASLPTLTDGAQHSPEGTLEAPGVYVRDMDRAPSEEGAFTLASAEDHSAQSLTYEFPGAEGEELAADQIAYGATAQGRSAITADGRTVVFVTTAQSDLDGPGTPPLQVAVRHLDSKETELVSVRYDSATGEAAVDPETGRTEPVPISEGDGAVWSRGLPPFVERDGQVERGYKTPQLAGASISADGSTVAWLGQQIGEQAIKLPAEVLSPRYAEPLWRRISEGPLAPTRRVTGGSDPENPACRADPESELRDPPSTSDPCQGPFATQDTGGFGTWNGAEEADVTPRLSANGDDVAFISTAPLTTEAGGFGLGGSELDSDAYWMDMTAPSKVAGLHQLTQFASGEKNKVSTNAYIDDIAISSDGLQVAFATQRTVFPLGVPAYVSQPAAQPGLAELYDVDLGDETLTRATRGYEGGVPEHPEFERGDEDRYARVTDGALSPSFSQDGATLAFSSTAANLVFGDGNTPPISAPGEFDDGADVFLVPRVVFSPEPTPQTISPAPPNPVPQPPWKLSVSVSSLRNGTIRIRARIPADGTLATSATSALPASAARGGHRKVKRTVARLSGVVRPPSSGIVEFELKLSGPYSALASRSDGLPGTLTVTFTAKGHPTLRKTLAVRFVRRAARRRKGSAR